jgi:hypothetical protein
MKILALALALAATASTAGPSAEQFNTAMAEACPDHRAATRNVSCARAEEGSIQFSCRYELQGADGRWGRHEAVLQQAEGAWVWIEGATLCGDEEEPSLN